MLEIVNKIGVFMHYNIYNFTVVLLKIDISMLSNLHTWSDDVWNCILLKTVNIEKYKVYCKNYVIIINYMCNVYYDKVIDFKTN